MRKFTPLVLAAATGLGAPALADAQAVAAAPGPQTVIGATVLNPSQASISGTALSPTGQPIGVTPVRARNLLTGQIGGTATTSPGGEFNFVGLPPGQYVIEVLDDGGQIIGTSAFISAAAGSLVAATVTATTGALTAVSTVTGLAAVITTTAAETVKFAAAAAGVAGMVAPPELPTASPSR